nr:GntR family transcriptional regulator [Actinomycetales bacterium]
MSGAVVVDLSSGVPPYEQIRGQVAGLIATGSLHPGDRLPTVRDLATDLGVAVGTATRAYRELESAGLVVSRRRVGTVVAEGVAPTHPEVAEAAAALVTRARGAGMGDDDVLALVRGVLLR